MKSLVRWGITFGLVGTTLLGAAFGGSIPVLALPEQQIKNKLDDVPVFLITNDKGLPLSRPLPDDPNGKKNGGSVTGVYMSNQEAKNFIQELQKAQGQNPQLEKVVKNLQVTAVPLGSIYQQIQKTKNQPDRLVFAFKPEDTETQEALKLLRQGGQNIDQFKSVPVFAVRFAPDQSYVAIQAGQEKQQIIPLFLSNQDAQGLLNQVKPRFPTADIQVIDVDGVIKTLQEQNDDWLKQVRLVPSAESRQYIINIPKK